jgi:oxygen-independent coproporphyrinogen-3 oxidase
MKKIGLYIHIPFCQNKCYYCDFISYPDRQDLTDKYFNYLKKEIDIYSDKIKDYCLDTIFIGGGTPSIVDGKYIYELINYLDKRINLGNLREVTIESNPKTLDEQKLSVYKEVGINRISMGLQTLENRLLKKIGRIHTAEDFYESYNLVRKWGFNNVNVDIMFNLPDQTINDVLNTLKKVIELNVEHISFYSLKIEENTPFYVEYQKDKLNLPDDDIEREMYHKGISLLQNNGYKHYEISNLSKTKYECIHNMKYWKVEPYIGLGLNSHSNIDNKRYSNYSDFNSYFSILEAGKLPIEEIEYIDAEMERAEYAILGLRLINGINKQDFLNRFRISIDSIYGAKIKKFIEQGFLTDDKEHIKFTKMGLDLCNIVFKELLP